MLLFYDFRSEVRLQVIFFFRELVAVGKAVLLELILLPVRSSKKGVIFCGLDGFFIPILLPFRPSLKAEIPTS